MDKKILDHQALPSGGVPTAASEEAPRPVASATPTEQVAPPTEGPTLIVPIGTVIKIRGMPFLLLEEARVAGSPENLTYALQDQEMEACADTGGIPRDQGDAA